MSDPAAPSFSGRHVYHLDLKERGSVQLKLEFFPSEIKAALHQTPGVQAQRRADRRAVHRWTHRILKPLNRDPRPMRMVTTQGARVSAIGFEIGGKIAVFYQPE